MTPKQPRLEGRHVEKVLAKAGFRLVRQSGSHARWRHPDGRATTVPRHSSRVIPPGTFKAILEDTGMLGDDFR